MNLELLDEQLTNGMLVDALAFIDSYERLAPASKNSNVVTIAPAPAVAFGPVVSPPSSSVVCLQAQVSSSEPKKQRTHKHDLVPNPNLRSRNRPRGDSKLRLERVREQVKLLEMTLARLKSTSSSIQPCSSLGAMLSSVGASDRGVGENTGDKAKSSPWKLVALRQFQRRTQAEMANRKLKQALAKQLKLAKTLEALYSKHLNQSDIEVVRPSRGPILHCEKMPLGREDSVSCLLMGHAQQLSCEVGIHLINSGLIGSEARNLRTVSKSDLFLGTVHETTSSTPLPLPLEDADRILWGAMTMLFSSEATDRPPKNASISQKDCVDKSFAASVKCAQHSYFIMTRTLTRRFVETDRIVFAWTSIGTVANKNVRYLGEGLTVFERSSAAPKSSIVLKNWLRLHAEQGDPQLCSSVASPRKLENFKVTGMRSLSQHAEGYFNLLEDVLVDAATGKSKSEPLCVI